MAESQSTVNLKAVPFDETEELEKRPFEETAAWKKLARNFSDDPTTSVRRTTIRPPQTIKLKGTDWTSQRDFLASDEEPKYLLEEVIGQGTSSFILTGRQQSLRRTVAFKRNGWSLSDSAQETLLAKEAMLTASLEHPNIIPVYDLTWDQNDDPLMVMKQVEGSTWSSYLKQRPSPESARWSSWLLRQVEVLLEVCKAMQYAHKHGVLHLGLKTDDIMIGDFGEVHIIDWELAQRLETVDGSLTSTPPGRRTTAAPEQREPHGEVGPQTDIYLLGAILFEILSGTRISTYQSIDFSLLPEETTYLNQLCCKAMEFHPAARYSNVRLFQNALQEFQKHWSSIQISSKAKMELQRLKLRATMQSAAQDVRQQTDRLFAQCHFGFVQALELWTDNQEARQGLQDSLETMIRIALQQEGLSQAESLLKQLPESNQDLENEWELLQLKHARRQNELERMQSLRSEYNPELGKRLRRFSAIVLSALWAMMGAGVLVYLSLSHMNLTTRSYLIFDGFWLFSVLLMGWLGRKQIHRVRINLSFFQLLFLVGIARIAIRLLCLSHGVELYASYSLVYLLQATIFSLMALFFGRMLFLCTAMYLVALLVSMYVHSPYWFDFMIDLPALWLMVRWYTNNQFQTNNVSQPPEMMAN